MCVVAHTTGLCLRGPAATGQIAQFDHYFDDDPVMVSSALVNLDFSLQ